MGRHRKLSAADSMVNLKPRETTIHAIPKRAPDLSDVDPDRRRHIEKIQPKSVSAEMADLLRPWVVWCVTRVPFTASQTDHKRVGQTYLLLAEDMHLHGEADPVRAFRYKAVNAHLSRRQKAGMSGNSLAAIRANLFAIGRIVAPSNYPPPRAGSDRPHVKPAATSTQVRMLEAAAQRIPGVVGARLRVILDLTTHAGARAKELTKVRGGDIVQQRCDGRLLTLVRLVNPSSGRARMVPVLDPVVALRLVKQADAVGQGGPLLGTPGNMKNAVNKVFSCARSDHGLQVDVTADQLRGYYITRLTEAPIPVATVLHLTDLGNSHSLYEYTRDVKPAPRSAQVQMLAGVLR